MLADSDLDGRIAQGRRPHLIGSHQVMAAGRVDIEQRHEWHVVLADKFYPIPVTDLHIALPIEGRPVAGHAPLRLC